MRRLDIFLAALLAVSLASCGGETTTPNTPGTTTDDNKKDNTDDNGGGSVSVSPWVLSASKRLSGVEVSCNGTPLEEYAFSYDNSGRLSSLVKKDKVSGETLYDLSYGYSGDAQASIAGKYFGTGSERTITATAAPGELSYKGDWADAWGYTAKYDTSGVILSLGATPSFSANGYYSSSADYAERYEVSSGNVLSATTGTTIDARSDKGTSTHSTYDVSYIYEYSDKADRQNFAVFLMPCQFPVWYATGFPGNRNLLSGMSMKLGSIEGQMSFTVDYELDTEGNIVSATQTMYAGKETLMTKTFTLSYAK